MYVSDIDRPHVEHCCEKHGCKFGDTGCPVAAGLLAQEPGACHQCNATTTCAKCGCPCSTEHYCSKDAGVQCLEHYCADCIESHGCEEEDQ